VNLGECARHSTIPRCQSDYQQPHQADANGNLSTQLTVSRLVRPDGSGLVDCRRPPGCVVAVLSSSGTRVLASARIEFAPNGPEPVFPVLRIGASAPFADRQVVPLTGSGFRPGTGVSLTECTLVSGLPSQCDGGQFLSAAVDSGGNFSASFMMTTFVAAVDGSEVDCRRVPCAVVAQPFDQALPGFVPTQFGHPVPRRGRYLDDVFKSVDVQRGIVYSHAVNSRGEPVDLALDVYAPANDAATRRPVIMLMFGGSFAFGERTQLQTLARAFALRGYVVVNIDYRTRPELLSGGGDAGAAIHDAQDDARAAVGWIRSHASSLRIDERAIIADGWSAGAITALNLAHPWITPAPRGSNVAAAVSMAGLLLGQPVHRTDPPTLAFGGNHDSILAFSAEVNTCVSIRAAGGSCDMVGYAGQRPQPKDDPCVARAVPCTYVLGRDEDHSIPFTERHDIVERTSLFLADHVLRRLGLLQRDDAP
jgi:dienelactone hydrolase